MARSYWERWNWELKQRKEAMLRERALSTKRLGSVTVAATNLLEIDPALLHDPVLNRTETEVYLGQGSFGVVQLKLFRGIKVAVKKMQPKTVMSDVRNEACILAQLSHPFLPHLFGVCTANLPYRIIMQFHGLGDAAKSFTMSRAIVARKITDGYAWLGTAIQLMQALSYLHDEVKILHNDITDSNILLADSITENPLSSNYIQIILIDFGKATGTNTNRKYHLSDIEKAEYTRKYPHLAPEVIDGLTTLSTRSDTYAAGRVIQCIIDHDRFNNLSRELRSSIQKIVTSCRLVSYTKRLSSKQALQSFQELMNQ